MEKFDVVVVGGQLVGSVLAAALGTRGFKTLLIDPDPPTEPRDDDDWALRISAFGPPALRIMDNLGVDASLYAPFACPYQGMEIWDQNSSGELSFRAAEFRVPSLGSIVENHRMRWALWQRLGQISELETESNVPFEQLLHHGDTGCEIQLADGRQIECRLLVGADGRNSRVRAEARIDVDTQAYGQKGLVAVVGLEHDHEQIAWQRFCETGPVAILPLPDGKASLVWTLPDELAGEYQQLDEVSFSNKLSAALGGRLGKIELLSQRACFPLILQMARNYIAPGVALAGDAAHVVHPLAGQGANLGIIDAAALAQTVGECESKQQQIGALHRLRRYQRWRKSDAAVTGQLMDGLNRVFKRKAGPVVWGRGMAMNLVDRTPAKSLFAQHVLGPGGDHPDLAQPASSRASSIDA